jgi:hypothetical protein
MAMQQQHHHQTQHPHHPQHTYMRPRYDAVVEVAPTYFKEDEGLHALAEASVRPGNNALYQHALIRCVILGIILNF